MCLRWQGRILVRRRQAGGRQGADRSLAGARQEAAVVWAMGYGMGPVGVRRPPGHPVAALQSRSSQGTDCRPWSLAGRGLTGTSYT